jgi:hypothetical protein
MEGSIVKILRAVLIAGGALCVASLTPGRAMPVSDLAQVAHDAATPAQTVADAATLAPIAPCRSSRCGWRPSYRYYYPRALAILRVYYGGCAPGWVDCWTEPHPFYGRWYQPPDGEGYAGWPYY